MKSPIYWHPKVYRLVMQLLYGKSHDAHYHKASRLIPTGDVLELCCGDSYFARFVGKDRYRGIELNACFVRSAQRRGLNVVQTDIKTGLIPKADTIVLLDSLYQFIPHEEKLIRRMLRNARKHVIILEPVHNLSQSTSTIVAKLSHWLTNPGTGSMANRFTKKRLEQLAKKYGGEVREAGKDLLLVFTH